MRMFVNHVLGLDTLRSLPLSFRRRFRFFVE